MLRISGCALVILLMVFFVGAATAAEPVRLPVDAAKRELPDKDWFGAYLNDTKVGFAEITLDRSDDEKHPGYMMESVFTISIVSMGQLVEQVMTERQYFAEEPPHALIYAEMKDSGGTSIVLAREEGEFKAVVETAGTQHEKPMPGLDYALADILTTQAWIEGKPAEGDALGSRYLSLSTLAYGTAVSTVQDVKHSTAGGVEKSLYEISARYDFSDQPIVAVVDERGDALLMQVGAGLELRLEDEATAKRTDLSTDIFASGMARVDKPLGDKERIETLTMKVGGRDAAKVAEGPCQNVKSVDGALVVTVSSCTDGPEATAEEIAEMLKEDGMHPVSHAKIQKLAKQAVGDAKTDLEKVRKLTAFVSQYVVDKLTPQSLNVFQIMEGRSGDCTEHSVLLTTLARAASIPARNVVGLAYMGDDMQAFGGHMWNEVVVDGRIIQVDATFDQVPADAARVRLTSDVFGMLGEEYAFELVSAERKK